MKYKIYYFIFIGLFCCSCNVIVKDIPGTYVSNFRVNNIDTLWINADGTYEKHVYRISDNKLELFLKYGANQEHKNNVNKTPKDIASRYENLIAGFNKYNG